MIMVLHLMYPSLVSFLRCQSLPLTLEMNTNSSRRKDARLGEQLSFFFLSHVSFFHVTGDGTVRSRCPVHSVQMLGTELTSSLSSSLWFMIESLLNKIACASISINDIREDLRSLPVLGVSNCQNNRCTWYSYQRRFVVVSYRLSVNIISQDIQYCNRINSHSHTFGHFYSRKSEKVCTRDPRTSRTVSSN
jgi:hypothetical protein